MFSLSPWPTIPTVSLTYSPKVSPWVNLVRLTTSTELTEEPLYDAETTNPTHDNDNRKRANVLFWPCTALILRFWINSDTTTIFEKDRRMGTHEGKRPTLTTGAHRQLGYVHGVRRRAERERFEFNFDVPARREFCVDETHGNGEILF